MDSPRVIRRYWDATCFLSVLNGEPAAPICERILDLAIEKKTEIWISPLVQVEVARPRASRPPAPDSHRARVRELFERAPVRWRDIDRDISALSQIICWDFGVHPRDAVHVAAAVESGCDLLETHDKKLLRLSGRLPNDSMRELLTHDADRAPLRIEAPDEPVPGGLFSGGPQL